MKLLSTVFYPIPLDKEEAKRLKKEGNHMPLPLHSSFPSTLTHSLIHTPAPPPAPALVLATKTAVVRDVNHALRTLDLSGNRLSATHALPPLMRMLGEEEESVSAVMSAFQSLSGGAGAGANASAEVVKPDSPVRAGTGPALSRLDIKHVNATTNHNHNKLPASAGPLLKSPAAKDARSATTTTAGTSKPTTPADEAKRPPLSSTHASAAAAAAAAGKAGTAAAAGKINAGASGSSSSSKQAANSKASERKCALQSVVLRHNSGLASLHAKLVAAAVPQAVIDALVL